MEAAFRGALTESGTLSPEGSVALLEVIYDRVNRSLVTGSGRATAVSYRRYVRSLWDEHLAKNVDVDGLEASMILTDPGRDWDRIGSGEDAERVKRAYRIASRLGTDLFDEEFLVAWVRTAVDGFFHYRRDLILIRSHYVRGEAEITLRWLREDSRNDSDPADDKSDT